MQEQVETDIEQLQMKVAFQEDAIDALNSALIDQQTQLEEVQLKIKRLLTQLESIDHSDGLSEGPEAPPPHY
ncbi:MAG: SlyX protein [Paraglaciecola sp.]|jgi:SlyX protein